MNNIHTEIYTKIHPSTKTPLFVGGFERWHRTSANSTLPICLPAGLTPRTLNIQGSVTLKQRSILKRLSEVPDCAKWVLQLAADEAVNIVWVREKLICPSFPRVSVAERDATSWDGQWPRVQNKAVCEFSLQQVVVDVVVVVVPNMKTDETTKPWNMKWYSWAGR